MNAIRRDEDTDNIHSIYVDQWTGRRLFPKRKETWRHFSILSIRVYEALKDTEAIYVKEDITISSLFFDEIFFITSQSWKICIGPPT